MKGPRTGDCAQYVGPAGGMQRGVGRSDRDSSTYPATPVTLPGHTVVDLSAEAAGRYTRR